MAQNKTTEGKGRGRPRAYDPQTALQQALGVFWNTGYSGASLDSIASAAGMNRPSLYAAFGDKHALYIKALDQYWQTAHTAMQAALTDSSLTLEQALTGFYEGQLAIYFSGDGQPRGCFAIGTATTEAVEDPRSARCCLHGSASSMPISKRACKPRLTPANCNPVPIRQHWQCLPPRCCTAFRFARGRVNPAKS